ncbi:molybdenum cofactor biosynthesis protein MoaE [Chloroflexota bacterium]
MPPFIEVTEKPLSPEAVINRVITLGSGCTASYTGLIRDTSEGKKVHSVIYTDRQGKATARLTEIAEELMQKWPLEAVAITHRTGEILVGEMNLIVAVASAHRTEAIDACRHAVDLFKANPPTNKSEKYSDGTDKSWE